MPDVKVFAIQEANELLPRLTLLLEELQTKRDQVADLEVKIDALELVGGNEIEELIKQREDLVAEFYVTVDEIHANGCFLKDADMGLIDFYGMLDGKLVLFCWRLGEETVGFWHDADKGYTWREPLPESLDS